jgi:hypothetical protein
MPVAKKIRRKYPVIWRVIGENVKKEWVENVERTEKESSEKDGPTLTQIMSVRKLLVECSSRSLTAFAVKGIKVG